MTLDEAIKHAEEVAEEQIKEACNLYDDKNYEESRECIWCAEEHRQLAEWLKELKDYKERIPSYEAGYNDAKRGIALSGEYERAYERGKADAQTERWISVGERLPEDSELVLFSTKTDRVFEGRYFADNTDHQWYAFRDETFAWNNVVTAWMPLPKPYEPQESEEV